MTLGMRRGWVSANDLRVVDLPKSVDCKCLVLCGDAVDGIGRGCWLSERVQHFSRRARS